MKHDANKKKKNQNKVNESKNLKETTQKVKNLLLALSQKIQ